VGQARLLEAHVLDRKQIAELDPDISMDIAGACGRPTIYRIIPKRLGL